MSNARNLANLLGTDTKVQTADIADAAFQANKNLVINSAMQVAQRGTSFSTTGSFPVDRFSVGYGVTSGTFTVSQDTTSPTDFSNSIKYLVGTAASAGSSEQAFVGTTFEGYSTSHLNFGTSDAKAITLSFWVRSSVTGTYCVAFINNAFDRSYIAEYSISSADTWEYKTITVGGDTSGTWVGAVNTRSMLVRFDLGSGSSFNTTANAWQSGSYRNTSSQANLVNNASATWYITGVQLEVGDTATPFEHRSYGDELARCQRYYWRIVDGNTQSIGTGTYYSSTALGVMLHYPVTMRASPSKVVGGGTNYFRSWRNGGSDDFNGFANFYNVGKTVGYLQGESADGVSGTSGQSALVVTNNASAYVDLDAEL